MSTSSPSTHQGSGSSPCAKIPCAGAAITSAGLGSTSQQLPDQTTGEKYIETHVHPILEKLGEALAAAVPDDVDKFVHEWLLIEKEISEQTVVSGIEYKETTTSTCKTTSKTGAKDEKSNKPVKNLQVTNSQRREFVQNQVSPLLWQITYDCLTNRPIEVVQFLADKFRRKVHRRSHNQNRDSHLSQSQRSSGIHDSDNDGLGLSEDDEVSEKEVERMRLLMHDRRIGVSAEKMSSKDMKNYQPPYFEKTETQKKDLKNLIRRSKDGKIHMLFGLVSDATLDKVVDAMELKEIKKSINVIEQGQPEGDYFYIVQNGAFDILVNNSKVFEAGPGFSFGELALLYNAPRSATIKANIDSTVWRLDRLAFRMLVVTAQELKMQEYVNFLQKVPIFETLSGHEVSRLAEVVQEEDFEEDEAIIEQGAVDNSMFIVLQGSCVACIRQESKTSTSTSDSAQPQEEDEIEVANYGPSDYFGEIALLNSTPRKASVYATEPNTVLLMVDAPSFRRILGPVKDILKRKISLYQKYDDFFQVDDVAKESSNQKDKMSLTNTGGTTTTSIDASSLTSTAGSGGNPTASASINNKLKQAARKYRKRGAETGAKKANKESCVGANAGGTSPTGGSRGFTSTTLLQEKEPETLKEKIAADFARPNLVQAIDDFSLSKAFKNTATAFSVLGELKPEQKFKDNKPLKFEYSTSTAGAAQPSATTIIPVTKKTTSETADNEINTNSNKQTSYSFQVPSTLKGPTTGSLFIQKGQKHNFDPTPNQDNMFFHTFNNGILLTGVCDGHGPFGHIVSLRLVQSLPFFLVKNNEKLFCGSATTLHSDVDWQGLFNKAFGDAMQDLVDFGKKENVNLDVSGSTASVLLKHEQKLHLAWVGDSNIMIASYNRHDSTEIFTTDPHVPESEKDRVESLGLAEVREIAENSYRIYLKGQSVPGLTMSRAMGDLMLQGKGVTCLPSYKQLAMQPGDEWFAIVASDGIWEFLTSEEVVKFAAKKLRLKGVRETNKALIDSSRKRWAQVEGDYCDDIASLVLMFNCKPLPDSSANMLLQVEAE
ncbi:unnamed protein product [Amoebophrya sp. A120]|nr:unnamed protein product [Amoebophrya sp. A120]|eukprot:GSA120T00009254001.1